MEINIMKYKKIIEGVFIERPNRFLAKVLINNREELVHVRNTGRCKELLISGAKIILEDCGDRPNRKTRYSLIAVWKNDMLVNMDSQVPNAVVYESLLDNKVFKLKNLSLLKREVTYSKSRFDLYFESEDQKGFIEVKGVTLENDGVAMFPDAPTERGTKHILEMIQARKEGYRGIIFLLIQMKGPHVFTPNYKTDIKFCESLILAKQEGVEIFVYDSIVTPNEIKIGNQIPIEINKKLLDLS